jgi:hypothetical protein
MDGGEKAESETGAERRAQVIRSFFFAGGVLPFARRGEVRVLA